MSRRTLAFIVFALAMAAGCVRLGFWQLRRLSERRARNASISSRLHLPPATLGEVLRDTVNARYRQVQLRGRYDYARELVYTSRSRNGAPGVQLLTPLLVAEGQPPVLINRGWVYAPDGMTVDIAQWHEGDTASVIGYVELFQPARAMVSTSSVPRAVRMLARDSIEARIGERVAGVLVVQRQGSDQTGNIQHPSRLDVPSLDEGSHRAYAMQWFAFAAIAVLGVGAVVSKQQPPGLRR